MIRNDLASPPAEAGPPTPAPGIWERLAAALEAIASAMPGTDPELKLYTPAEAAVLLGKTENWVVEAIQGRRIPFTHVGKSPRLTAEHLREIATDGEVKPHRYARKRAA